MQKVVMNTCNLLEIKDAPMSVAYVLLQLRTCTILLVRLALSQLA
jgi:hypothetical protein